jgi:hypothetical protein
MTHRAPGSLARGTRFFSAAQRLRARTRAVCQVIDEHWIFPAAEPLSTRDITVQLFTLRALNQGDQSLFRLMTKRVGVSLRDYRTKGVVRSVDGPGMYNLWEIAR